MFDFVNYCIIDFRYIVKVFWKKFIVYVKIKVELIVFFVIKVKERVVLKESMLLWYGIECNVKCYMKIGVICSGVSDYEEVDIKIIFYVLDIFVDGVIDFCIYLLDICFSY